MQIYRKKKTLEILRHNVSTRKNTSQPELHYNNIITSRPSTPCFPPAVVIKISYKPEHWREQHSPRARHARIYIQRYNNQSTKLSLWATLLYFRGDNTGITPWGGKLDIDRY